ARAGNKNKEASSDQDRQRPLHFRAVIAEPKKRERNNDRRSSRTKGEPGQFPLMRKPVATFRWIHCSLWRQTCRPHTHAAMQWTRLPLQSQTILLQPPIKCASAQAESFRCLACIAIVSRQRLRN